MALCAILLEGGLSLLAHCPRRSCKVYGLTPAGTLLLLPGEGWQVPRIPTGLTSAGGEKKTPPRGRDNIWSPSSPVGQRREKPDTCLSDFTEIVVKLFRVEKTESGRGCLLPQATHVSAAGLNRP